MLYTNNSCPSTFPLFSFSLLFMLRTFSALHIRSTICQQQRPTNDHKVILFSTSFHVHSTRPFTYLTLVNLSPTLSRSVSLAFYIKTLKSDSTIVKTVVGIVAYHIILSILIYERTSSAGYLLLIGIPPFPICIECFFYSILCFLYPTLL